MSESRRLRSLREFAELSAVGASCAANALGAILGREVAAAAPREVAGGRYQPRGRWPTGVIFQADGFLSGLVAILLPEPERVTGLAVGEQPDEAVESALRELGNIVASHTVSAIANDLGGTILLSVPTLVMDDADRVLATLVGERHATHCFESDLFDSDGELAAAIVFVPELKGPAPSA